MIEAERFRHMLREAVEYLIDAHPNGDSEFIQQCRAALATPAVPFASGSLPPLPEPCNKGQTLMPDYGLPWSPLFNRHQMYEYARQSVHLVDEELLGFARWLLEAYHSEGGMPEAKEIAKEARAAIALATGTPAEPAVRYDGLHEYAQRNRLDYNELCRVVRASALCR